MAGSVTLEEGQRLLAACLEAAHGRGLAVSVVVVDASGTLVCAARMDRALPLTPDVALGKACASIGFRRSGRELGELWGPGAAIPAAMAIRTGGRFVAAQGSLLLRDGDEVVGAIGVSGAKSSEDEEIAQTGVDAFRR
jgi:uncharacterized protein GlcG (DUF336 family)